LIAYEWLARADTTVFVPVMKVSDCAGGQTVRSLSQEIHDSRQDGTLTLLPISQVKQAWPGFAVALGRWELNRASDEGLVASPNLAQNPTAAQHHHDHYLRAAPPGSRDSDSSGGLDRPRMPSF